MPKQRRHIHQGGPADEHSAGHTTGIQKVRSYQDPRSKGIQIELSSLGLGYLQERNANQVWSLCHVYVTLMGQLATWAEAVLHHPLQEA